MNRLPSEVLTVIFNHLHYSQKLHCKLVCRKWAKVLQSGSDIESIAIPFRWEESKKSYVFLPLIEKVQQGILNGENCRRLILFDYPDRALLANLFPNLKLIYFQKDRPYGQALESLPPGFNPEQIEYLHHWHTSLETFIESNYDAMALDILDSGVFQRLSTIVLVNSRSRPVKMNSLADKLKNTPNLKTLHLDGFQIDTLDLEKLHSNTPCLKSLLLDWCQIKAYREQSKVIQPAKTMKELSLINCSYPDGFSMALSQYITSTYSSVREFSLMIDYRNFGMLEEELPIRYTIQKLTRNLRAFKSDVICISPDCIMELANNAPYLEELSVDVGDDEELLTIILESDTLINTLRSLSLHYTSDLNLNLFNRFRYLKQLSLVFEGTTFNDQCFELDTVINCLPDSLDALEIGKIDLELSPTYENDNTIHPIRSLNINYSFIKCDLSGYLSRRFPKLKSLVIELCESEFDFLLPNHHLSFVEFDLYQDIVATVVQNEHGNDTVDYLTKYFKLTTGGDVSTFYEPKATAQFNINKYVDGKCFDQYDSLQYNIYKPFTKYQKEEELKCFHFQCASVQTLLLNRHIIL